MNWKQRIRHYWRSIYWENRAQLLSATKSIAAADAACLSIFGEV